MYDLSAVSFVHSCGKVYDLSVVSFVHSCGKVMTYL